MFTTIFTNRGVLDIPVKIKFAQVHWRGGMQLCESLWRAGNDMSPWGWPLLPRIINRVLLSLAPSLWKSRVSWTLHFAFFLDSMDWHCFGEMYSETLHDLNGASLLESPLVGRTGLCKGGKPICVNKKVIKFKTGKDSEGEESRLVIRGQTKAYGFGEKPVYGSICGCW